MVNAGAMLLDDRGKPKCCSSSTGVTATQDLREDHKFEANLRAARDRRDYARLAEVDRWRFAENADWQSVERVAHDAFDSLYRVRVDTLRSSLATAKGRIPQPVAPRRGPLASRTPGQSAGAPRRTRGFGARLQRLDVRRSEG
jgi:hypothetical protein